MMIKDGNKIGKFFGILICCFICVTVIGIFIQKKDWEKYPEVTYRTELNGVISNIRINRGTFAEFKNGQKFSLPSSDNLSYIPYVIGRFINKGDSISKPAFSDSIFIYRDKDKYYFVLGQSIEE